MLYPTVRFSDGRSRRVSLIWLNYGVSPMAIECTTLEPEFAAPVENKQVIDILRKGLQAIVSIDGEDGVLQQAQLVQENGSYVLLCSPCAS